MAIILKVSEPMDERGLSEAEQAQLAGLGREAAAIRSSTLDGERRALGCSLGDVLGYVPDGE